MKGTIIDRFESKYIPVTESGCWLWIGASGHGYGSFKINGKTKRAHRFSYELFVGKIPDGLELDHKCRVTCCVNPAHLEPVTHQENVRRGTAGAVTGAMRLSKTHCPKGHHYFGTNLYVTKRGERVCKECKRTGNRKFRGLYT